jgi:hypothetical protein
MPNKGDQVYRAGITPIRDTMSLQPARQLIVGVRHIGENMGRSDFEKQDVDSWMSRQKVVTPIAEFAVRLEMGGKREPPNEEMLRCADEFIALVRANVEAIHDKIYEHYQYFDEDWLEQCEVPNNLSRDGVLEYLQFPALTVERSEDAAEPYVCQVYLLPDWDAEHPIRLQFSDGGWANQVAWWIWGAQ